MAFDRSKPGTSEDKNTRSDWVIPLDQRLSISEADLDDFVLGENLLEMVLEAPAEAVPKDLRLDGMLLVHHTNAAENNNSPPETVDNQRHNDNLLVRGSTEMLQKDWREISSPAANGPADQEWDTFFSGEMKFLQEVNAANIKMHEICLTLLEQCRPDSPEEMGRFKNQYLSNRDQMKEYQAQVQAWINQSILVGDLKQMQQFKQLNEDLYKTTNILRQINTEFNFDRPEIKPLAISPTTPTFDHFFVRKKEKSKQEKWPPEKPIRRSPVISLRSSRVKTMFLFVVFLLIPLVYFSAKPKAPDKGIKVEVHSLPSVMPIENAHLQGKTLIVQIREEWRTLPRAKRKEDLLRFYEETRQNHYETILVYFPNGVTGGWVNRGIVTLL